MNRTLKSIGLGILTIFIFAAYAYGFQVTKVDLEETQSEKRQTQLFRIIRALFQPDIIEYELNDLEYEVDFMLPCPEDGYTPNEKGNTEAQISVEPACASEGDFVIVTGKNLPPKSDGRIYFIPPSEVTLRIGQIETDSEGNFEAEVQLPERSSTEVQRIRLLIQERISGPYISQNAKDTWDKIVETVFLALLATTFGIIVAIPLSFFAARNLMEDMTNSMVGVSLSIILAPIGLFLASRIAGYIKYYLSLLPHSIWIYLGVFSVGLIIIYFVSIWSIPQREEEVKKDLGDRIKRIFGVVVISITLILEVVFLSKIFVELGDIVKENIPALAFIGIFLGDIGGIIDLLYGLLLSIAGGYLFISGAKKLSKLLINRTNEISLKIFQVFFAAIAGGILLALIGAGIEWLYAIEKPQLTFTYPVIFGAAAGALLGIITNPARQLPIGLVIFNLSRGIFNTLRSIDAVIMVIVFVVWVGIGPFAGVLALSLHTIAALAKLYSEQIESILEGPVEAVRATGANRLQTIVYAIIPQIVPPYISFTLYRWDINVRMSTIIGLGGGGGIGFLLIQNINLLNYRRASAQMIAIAVVVTIMDTLSSKLREKIT